MSDTRPLVVTAPPPTKKISDASLLVGKREVDVTGEPSRSTSVRRRVYDANGKLLYDTTFYSSYRGEPTIVRVGTKRRPKPAQTQTTTTSTSTTTPTTTSPRP